MDSLTRTLARLIAKSHRAKKCGARTRTGKPCKMRPAKLWGERCRLHGGLSTGPKTQEGRERIAEAQRRRWARWRQNNDGGATGSD
jgi:hypothetical protein